MKIEIEIAPHDLVDVVDAINDQRGIMVAISNLRYITEAEKELVERKHAALTRFVDSIRDSTVAS